MIEVFEDISGAWRFRVKGRNGEIVAASEGYTRKHDAMRGALTLVHIVETWLLTDQSKRAEVIVMAPSENIAGTVAA